MERFIVNSGERIKELRAARRMTRQQLAEQIGLSVDALRKIEAGVNGAKIDTLISIAELFHITLDYRFMCVVWEHAPVNSGELVKLCQEQLGWKKTPMLHGCTENVRKRYTLPMRMTTVSVLIPKEQVQAEDLAIFRGSHI